MKKGQAFPDETIVIGAGGKKEARIFISNGKDFIVYSYRDVESGKKLDKYSILLKHRDGIIEHLFIVPMSKGRELVVKHTFEKEKRAIYDEKNKEIIEF